MTNIETGEAPAKSRLQVRDTLFRIPAVFYGVGLFAVIGATIAITQPGNVVFVLDLVLFACIGAIAIQVLQGTGGLVSLGSAGFLLVGSFGSVFALRAGVPFPLDIIFAMVVAGGMGAIVGLTAVRLKSLFLALATLAAYFVAAFLGERYQGSVPSAQFSGFSVPVLFGEFGLDASSRYWAALLIVVVCLMLIGAWRLMHERSGRALRMIRENEHIAPTLGIPVTRYKLGLFTATSAVFGFQGALMAHFSGSVDVAQFTILLGFSFVIMVIVGGTDSLLGAVIGAVVVTALPIWTSDVVRRVFGGVEGSVNGPQYSLILYGAMVIIFVTVSRNGIVGWIYGVIDWLMRRFGGVKR